MEHLLGEAKETKGPPGTHNSRYDYGSDIGNTCTGPRHWWATTQCRLDGGREWVWVQMVHTEVDHDSTAYHSFFRWLLLELVPWRPHPQTAVRGRTWDQGSHQVGGGPFVKSRLGTTKLQSSISPQEIEFLKKTVSLHNLFAKKQFFSSSTPPFFRPVTRFTFRVIGWGAGGESGALAVAVPPELREVGHGRGRNGGQHAGGGKRWRAAEMDGEDGWLWDELTMQLNS